MVRLETSGDAVLYVEARELGPAAYDDEERELSGMSGESMAAITGAVDDVTSALGTFAGQLQSTLAKSGATKYTVEFGCEIAVETGKVVAVIGKGSATSSLKVTMEWDHSRE
ncbi:CU044_2847 family protein [Sphaerisporangium perillae]|uniref:CU044_2847 family protein n=1 Tax=Sphaerisporangium perillae TaxID=2935860 RepID=UPI00200C5A20|nr:CU044_2847 family protein [Sphaerisporangium perillae]